MQTGQHILQWVVHSSHHCTVRQIRFNLLLVCFSFLSLFDWPFVTSWKYIVNTTLGLGISITSQAPASYCPHFSNHFPLARFRRSIGVVTEWRTEARQFQSVKSKDVFEQVRVSADFETLNLWKVLSGEEKSSAGSEFICVAGWKVNGLISCPSPLFLHSLEFRDQTFYDLNFEFKHRRNEKDVNERILSF